jgi:hypothetical protein
VTSFGVIGVLVVHFERDVRLSAVPSKRRIDAMNGVD